MGGCVTGVSRAGVDTGVSERSGKVSWYNGCSRKVQMSIDNLAQLQVVSSAHTITLWNMQLTFICTKLQVIAFF